MSLALLVCLPFGLTVVAVLVAVIVDAIHNVRESRRCAPVRRETVPVLAWPYDAPRVNDHNGARLVGRGRSERGAADGGLLRRLALLCLVVFVTVGGCVYLIDQVVPERAAHRSPPVVDGTGPTKPQGAVSGGGERCDRG